MATKKQLEAAAATSGMFEQGKPKKTTAKKQNAPDPKQRELQTFSVKIDSDVLKRWRTYTTIEKYGETGKLTEKALEEYMNRHKLSPEQQAKFDILCGM